MQSSRRPRSVRSIRPTFVAALGAVVLLAFDGYAAPAPHAARSGDGDGAQAVRFDQTHAAWTALLAAHVQGGRVDWKGFLEDRAKLDAYAQSLEAVPAAEFATWKREEQLAFWIDAYNAYTAQRVLRSWPFERVDQLGAEKKGPWDEAFLPLAHLAPELRKEQLSLNDVENRIVRPKFADPRVHAALNCAAESCPPLLAEAYTAGKLGKQLDAQVARWLSNPALNRFDPARKKVELSKLFDWYGKDFVADAGSLEAWLAKHGPKELTAWLAEAKDVRVTFLDYSWKLNDVSRK